MKTLALLLALALPAAAGPTRKFKWSLEPADGGKSINLQDYRGQVVLLEFWTTTCGPCLEARPFFEGLQEKYRDQRVVVLSINTGEDPDLVRKWLAKHPSKLPVYLDPKGRTEKALGLWGEPAMALFDGNDQLNWSAVGFVSTTREEIETRMKREAPGERGSVPVGRLK